MNHRGGNRLSGLSQALRMMPPVVILGGLFLYPLAIMAASAFTGDAGGFSLAPGEQMLGSQLFLKALLHTLMIALTATFFCLVLGFVLALLFRLAPFRGVRVLSRVVDAYLAFPSFLIALSLTFLYGNAGLVSALFGANQQGVSFLYGFWGVVLAEVTFYTPFVLRPLLAGLEGLDAAQIEIASSLGEKPLGVIRHVVLPMLMPSLLAGGSLTLLLTVNEFGIMLVMGAKNVITLPVLIYGLAVQQFNYSAASVVALCNIALSLSLFGLYRLCLTSLVETGIK